LVSIKTGLTLGLIGAGLLAFYKLGGATGLGSRIGAGFSGFGQSLADAFKFPEFIVEKSGGIQYDEKVLEGKGYDIPDYYNGKTLVIPPGTVDEKGIFRSDTPPMTKEYQEQFMQSVPNVDLPNTTSTPTDPFPKVPSLSELFAGLRSDPASQTSTPAPQEPQVFDTEVFAPVNWYAAPSAITPNVTSTTGGESYGWKNKFSDLTGFEF
jgi:hypothetical protein|tara:strand:- start:2512 stop:3138 length:627 start_codon:yes stop_codon:yes gene_type:complete